MKTSVIARITAASIAVIALVTAGAAAAQETPVGINAAIRNSVQLRRAQAAAPHAAKLKERVALNDEISTGAASQLQILLLDRSTFTVGANAKLKVDRFVYDPDRNARAIGASVARGAFRFMSARRLGHASGPVTVRTPVASIGIRGTIFEGVVGEDAIRIVEAELGAGAAAGADKAGATLIILRGPGQRAQGDTIPGAIDITTGKRVITLNRPGSALYVPGNGLPPIGPFQISSVGRRSFQDLLRTFPPALPTSAGLLDGRSGTSPESQSGAATQAPVRPSSTNGLAGRGGRALARPSPKPLMLAGVAAPFAVGLIAITAKEKREPSVSPR